MYGAAHDENKDGLLIDLSDFCSHMTIAYFVGGYLTPLSIVVDYCLHCADSYMVKESRDAIVRTAASQHAFGRKKRRQPTGGKKGGKGTTSQPVEKI